MKIKKLMECEGCYYEIMECYYWQNEKGYSSGLIFGKDHCSVFVIEDKTGEFVIC